MPNGSQQIDVKSLLRLDEGLVHSDVYASEDVFELEIEKIFHQGWVYVGHESEVPNPGDYVLRWIGRQSVILNRDKDGKLHLFMNRCRHRANSICQLEKGNAANFLCNYHGWNYRNDGALVGVPRSDAYGDDFKLENFPLVSPRMEVYRGFVWGNLSQSGGSLGDHLGLAGQRSIDVFCDASPEGEIVVDSGCLKSLIFANWKFQGGDGYHAPFTHWANAGFMRAKRKNPQARNPVGFSGGSMEEGYLSRDLGNGHYCLDKRAIEGFGGGKTLPDTNWARKYRNDMVQRYGEERGEFLVRTGGNPHTVFMPNLHLVNGADLRIIRPLAADKCEIYFFCPLLKGAPDELNLARIRDVEKRMGASGTINVDDVEMFERNQFGMQQEVNPWKYMARGMGREHPDDDLKAPEAYRWSGTVASHFSDELTQRAQLRWWAERLSQ